VVQTAVSLQSISSTASNNWWLIVLFIVMGGLTAVYPSILRKKN